jgi:hypothetical protein
MPLSLLSDSYLSDAINDAGPFRAVDHAAAGGRHFPALCRGLVVIIALGVPLWLTILETSATTRGDGAVPIAPTPTTHASAAHAMVPPADDRG